MGVRGDLRLQASAFNQCYDISPEIRQSVIEGAYSIINDESSKKREKIAAMHLIIAADKLNLQLKQGQQEVEMLLWSIVKSKGLESEVCGIIEARGSESDGGNDPEFQDGFRASR